MGDGDANPITDREEEKDAAATDHLVQSWGTPSHALFISAHLLRKKQREKRQRRVLDKENPIARLPPREQDQPQEPARRPRSPAAARQGHREEAARPTPTETGGGGGGAASEGLGPNVDALKVELLYAQALLDNAKEREIRSPAMKELLLMLRQQAYDADDVLDELEYFRIQDTLDGTCHAKNVHDKGCVHGFFLNASQATRAVARKLKVSSSSTSPDDDRQDDDAPKGCFSGISSCGRHTPPSPSTDPDDHEDAAKQRCLSDVCSCGRRAISSSPKSPSIQSEQNGGCMSKATSSARKAAHTVGKCPCCSFPWTTFFCARPSKTQETKHAAVQPSKLKFDRVEISKKMKGIVEKLKLLSSKVSSILDVELGSAILNRTPTQSTSKDHRPVTTPDIIEPKLYGRENQKRTIVDGITNGQYFADDLVVLPIVGPGGIGKTTFTQHIYSEVKGHFKVAIWICVSLNFNVSRLMQEAVNKTSAVSGEKENSSAQERIELRLKANRFLVVLDDVWTCHEDEWKQLLAPFRRGGEKGNMIIVTTRIPKVAEMVKTVHSSIEMDRLGDDDLMHFFEECVFGEQTPWIDPPGLLDVGKKIVSKLKGFPLAAKTVGRLLRKQLTLESWTRVLESKEWEQQTNKNDIMPALKLSYEHLPFHLQQCFSYCSLFPEDYEFHSDELIHLWRGLGILHPCGQNTRTEDIGQSYLIDLVNYGFLKKEGKDDSTHYAVHDLLHDLAVEVSSYESVTLTSSALRSIQIPTSVRHLSIIIDDKEVENRGNFDNFKKELRELDKRFSAENLRTLMLFGSHHGSFAKTFGHLFREARGLRTIYSCGTSYSVEDILRTFSKLIHLRYLRIKSVYNKDICLPAAISRLYHLEIIDLQECNCSFGSTRHMSNLVKLRHFLVPDYKIQLHSNIFEVGKQKFLQELRRFEVGNESTGFELSQLGELTQLGGSLAICSLEKIQAPEEAAQAKLIHKNHLHSLTLEWNGDERNNDLAYEEKALEILIPHSNLRELCIRRHGGHTCPSWLGANLSVNSLEYLCLDDVDWKLFPPIGELRLADASCEECPSKNIPNTKFQNLTRLEFIKLHSLEEWVVDAPCQLFAHLEVLFIKECSKLTKLTFLHSICCHQEKESKINWFPSLQKLEIEHCPELQQFPPIPWRGAPCSAEIRGVGLGLKQLVCGENSESEYRLEIEAKDATDMVLWDMLVFHNLTKLKKLKMDTCPPLSLHHLQMLSSLRDLTVWNSTNVFMLNVNESHGQYQFPIESMVIYRCGANGKELTRLVNCLPNLSQLLLWFCEKIRGLDVAEKQQSKAAHGPSRLSSGNEVEQEHYASGEKEITAALVDDGVLLLPPQLEVLEIFSCPGLILCFDPLDDSKEAARTGGGRGRRGGLQGLKSLRSLKIEFCSSAQGSLGSTSIYHDHREDANYLNTPIEHYHEMATIFGNSLATGAYAKGANDPLVSEVTEMDIAPKITSSEPTELHDVDGGTQPFNNGAEYTGTKQPPSKKQRLATEDELIVMISKSLGELSASINKLAEPKLAVPKGLYEELKSIPGFDEAYLEHYYAYLCDNPPLARAFYALPLVSSKMIWVARYIKDHMPELM
ncbi:hypothetical protein U9M48_040462 [Paspalum notatum var. saurae]|uniref:AAA+ ATPase domain-containing protein n=1 Tax=Paspalum notatum var. saurae TaxID=547442 RepID=A0AAQ3UNG2_PASNO